jgi:hypothetical protein
MRKIPLVVAILSLAWGLGRAQAPVADPAPGSAAAPQRGWLGLRLQDLSADLAPKFGLSNGAQGALVADVAAQGPAQAAGLEPGDVIQAFGGQAVDSAAGLKALVGPSAGQDTVLRVWRAGKSVELTVKVGAKGGPGAAPAVEAKPQPPDLGLKLRVISPSEAAQAGLQAGLVVLRVAHGSPAEAGGLKPGDIVLELEHGKLADLDDWTRLSQALKPGTAALLRFRRGDRSAYQALALPAAPVPAVDAVGTAFTPIDVEYGTYWDENSGPYTAVSGYSHDGKPLTRLSQFKAVIEPLDDRQATQMLERASTMQVGGVTMVVVGAAACVGGLGNLLYQVAGETSSTDSTDGPNLLPFAVLFGGGTLLWVGGAVIALVGDGNVRPKAVERYNTVVEGMKNLSLMQLPDSKRMGLAYTQRF